MSAPLSVIVATRNRAACLEQCLRAFEELAFDSALYELLIVDNASTDRTAELVTDATRWRGLPLRWIHESRPGLAIARNRGVREAKGEAFVFLDDDAIAATTWLGAFHRHLILEKSPIVQGRIIPRFAAGQPRWVGEEELPYFGGLDQGERTGPLRGELHGGNAGMRREVMEKIGPFREELGLGRIGLGEDTEWSRRARAQDFGILYAPEALMYHLIPPERATRWAFLRRRYLSGLSQAVFHEYGLSRPRAVCGLARAAVARSARAVIAGDARERMRELGDLAEQAGRVRQMMGSHRPLPRAAGRKRNP